jgi:peptidoglycan hydrolase-like protein with peptidoglycan-binding domain
MSFEDDDDGLSLLGAEEFFPEVPGRTSYIDREKRGAGWGIDRDGNWDDVVGQVTVIPKAGANYTDAKTVAAVQKALNDHGYSVGTSGPNHDGVDGMFGSKTKAAIKKMQADINVGVTGIIDEGVISALGVTPGVLPPGVSLQQQAALQAQVALDAATAAEHATTPDDVQLAAAQVLLATSAAAPPPPPAVVQKLADATAQAKAAKTPAQVQAAAQAVKAAAQDVHAAVKPSWWVEPAWQGGWARWELLLVGSGSTVGLAGLLAAIL